MKNNFGINDMILFNDFNFNVRRQRKELRLAFFERAVPATTRIFHLTLTMDCYCYIEIFD
jgi:hypothetical protein